MQDRRHDLHPDRPTRPPLPGRVNHRRFHASALAVFLAAFLAVLACGGALLSQHVRPVDTAPAAEDIGGGYQLPEVQRPLPKAAWWHLVDAGILAACLALATWFVLVRRDRSWIVVLTVACLLYFGFYREGCVCPVGATQNVAVAVVDPGYAIPYHVIAIFFLPLVLALVVGRVFCAGVCPLGGIQDLVLIRPLQVPRRLDRALGSLKYIYLGLAIWFAVQPAVERDFIICRYDPFVGLFRQTGSGSMLILGGVFLLAGMFVGRPYCRYLCPYGALLALVGRFSWKRVTITPGRELDCGLCTEACPFGAIEKMRALPSSCLACGRCYSACPEQRAQWSREAVTVETTTGVSQSP